MNDRIRRQYNAFNKLGTFIATNATDYSATSALPGYGTQLKTIAGQIDTAKAGQIGGSGADVTEGVLGALLTDLQLIGGIARTNDADSPGLKDKFPTVGNTATSITATADAYLGQLEIQPADDAATQTAKKALAQIFIDHEMPATFVADLRADRTAIPAAVLEEDKTATDKVQDTANLDVLSQRGMQVRAKAISGLRARYSREREKLEAAESAAHVERAPQRPKNKDGDSKGGAAGK